MPDALPDALADVMPDALPDAGHGSNADTAEAAPAEVEVNPLLLGDLVIHPPPVHCYAMSRIELLRGLADERAAKRRREEEKEDKQEK